MYSMRPRALLTFLLVLGFAKLGAIQVPDNTQPRRQLAAENQELAVIDDCVDLSSGRFFVHEVGIRVGGPDPLILSRSHSSGEWHFSDVGYGFGLNYPRGIWNLTRLKHGFLVQVENREHSLMPMTAGDSKEQVDFGYSKRLYELGLSNVQGGGMSAATNPRQLRYSYSDWQHKHRKGKWVVSSGDGSRRHYCPRDDIWLLDHEELPSGNRKEYSYDKQFRLKRIETRSSDGKTLINFIDLSYKKDAVIATASDGQTATFHLQSFRRKCVDNPGFTLEGQVCDWVQSNSLPQTRYSWDKSRRMANLASFGEISKENGSLQKISYSDTSGRVLALTESVDTNQEKTKYKFDYKNNVSAVINSYGAKTHYVFDKTQRLSKLVTPDSVEVFEWDDCLLTKRRLESNRGRLLRELSFEYDQRGNVIREELRGCLCKRGKTDSFIMRYAYSDDDRNLLLSETYPSGRQDFYSYKPGTNLPLERRSVDSDGSEIECTQYRYDHCANLVQVIEQNGPRKTRTAIEPSYDIASFGQPRQVTRSYWDAQNMRWIQLECEEYNYNKQGLLRRKSNSNGSEELEYNAQRRCIRKTNALGEVTEYAYDSQGNCTLEQDVSSGRRLRNVYNLQNRPKEQCVYQDEQLLSRETKVWDVAGNLEKSTDRWGAVTSYRYDKWGRESSRKDPSGTTSREYSLLGHCKAVTDQDGYRTDYVHNVRGQPLHCTHPDGTIESWEYDVEGRVVKATDRSGLSTFYTYDSLGHCTQERKGLHLTTREYDGDYLIQETIDDRCTSRQYDGAGRLVLEDCHGRRTSFEYDGQDRLTETRQWEDDHQYIAELTRYNALSNITEKRREHSDGSLLGKELYSYDSLGNRTTASVMVSNTQWATTTYDYSALGELTKEVDAEGNSNEHSSYRKQGIEGHTLRTRDALGRLFIRRYNRAGRLYQEKTLAPDQTCIASCHYSYDGRGNKIEELHTIYDKKGVVDEYLVSWIYDSMSRCMGRHEPGRSYSFDYDQAGRPTIIRHPDGTELHQTYTDDGNLEELCSSDGSVDLVYSYDKRGRVVKAVNKASRLSVQRTYNIHDEIVEEIQGPHLQVYEYDALGRRLTHVLPDGTHTLYQYSSGRLSKISYGKFEHSVQNYDLLGCPTKYALPGALGQQTLAWDALARPKALHNQVIQTNAVTYSPVGMLASYSVKDPQGQYLLEASYDSWDNLTHERSHSEHVYSSDSLHRIQHLDDAPCTHGPDNELTKFANRALVYDKNGNRIQDGQCHYRYDALNRLIHADTADGSADYRYDAFGRRLFRNTTRLLYDGDCEIGSILNDGSFTSLRILAPSSALDIGAAVLIKLDDNDYVPLHDIHGNVVSLVDPQTGTATASCRYSAYGEHEPVGQIGPWRYASKRYDPITGLHHFGGRDYDASTATWVSADPLGFVDGPNLYAYVRNQPLNHRDPTGYCLDALDGLEYPEQSYYNREYYAKRIQDRARGDRDAALTAGYFFFGSTMDAYQNGESLGRVASGAGVDMAMLVGPSIAGRISKAALRCYQTMRYGNILRNIGGTKKALSLAARTRKEVDVASFVTAYYTSLVAEGAGLLTRNGRHSMPVLNREFLVRAGMEMDRNGLTIAGRALQKHGSRPGSIYPRNTGTNKEMNERGLAVLEGVVYDPNVTISVQETGQYGKMLRVRSGDGRAVRMYANGRMQTFLEP